MTFANIRRDYPGEPLLEERADTDPFRQFVAWFDEVRELEADPTAMALATAGADGQPSVRMVLMKGFGESGIVFFTSYESRKGREIRANSRASLVFFWKSRERQVRISGRVEKVSSEESDEYFRTRPLESRLAVQAAPQGEPLPDRATLDARYEEAQRRYPDGNVPRPEWWGGYRVVPEEFEFWQGRPSRLHDRLLYVREADGGWRRQRLAP